MTKYIDLPAIQPATHIDDARFPYNRWCGPNAASAITGIPAEEIAEFVRLRRGQSGTTKGIKGTWTSEIVAAIVACGFKAGFCYAYPSNLTLAQFLRKRTKRTATYLVATTTHFLVVRGNKGFCTQSGDDLVSVRKLKGRRSRVKEVYRIRKPSGVKAKAIALPYRHKKVWDEKKKFWRLVA